MLINGCRSGFLCAQIGLTHGYHKDLKRTYDVKGNCFTRNTQEPLYVEVTYNPKWSFICFILPNQSIFKFLKTDSIFESSVIIFETLIQGLPNFEVGLHKKYTTQKKI